MKRLKMKHIYFIGFFNLQEVTRKGSFFGSRLRKCHHFIGCWHKMKSHLLKIRQLKFSLDPKFIRFPGVFLCVVMVKLISIILALH